MNRKLLITQIIIWAVLGLFLIGVMVTGIVSGGFSLISYNLWNRGEMKQVHEETVAIDGTLQLSLDFRSTDISVTVTDDQDIRLVQYSDMDLQPNEFFSVEKSNGEILVKQGELRRILGLFNISPGQRLELFLPKSYVQNILIRTSSGNITMQTSLEAADIEFKLSSGNIRSEYAIKGREFDVTVTSGNIIFDTVSCDKYDIQSSSGNIDIAAITGSGEAKTTSGNVTIKSVTGTKHQINATSGDINLSNFVGSGSIHTSSGTIKVNLKELTGDVSASATSGDIRLNLPQSASFELSASCTSGDINTNFNMSYTKDGHKATAKVGSGPYVKLNVQTTSGNISVEQKQ